MNIFNTQKICSSLQTARKNAQAKFGSERVRMVELSKLHFDKDFKELFSQEPEKVERIAADMKVNGFDNSQPILVTKDLSILDGNSRYLASQKAGIKFVPIIIKDFKDKNEALCYELHLQLDRRNLSDAEIFSMFQKLEKMKADAKDEGKATSDFTDEKLAVQLKKSERQVQKMRELSKKADEKTLEKVSSGEITINQAYKEVKKVDKPVQKSDPSPVKINEFCRGVQFALDELSKGKTVEEILAEV